MNKTGSPILIVDDNPKNIQLLGNVLTEKGYSVEFALNGHDALNWVDEKEFDLILLDVMMPEMDGFEVCKHLKKNIKTREIPVIFLTSKTDSKSILRGFEMGAVDYISKPFNKNELLSRVTTHVALMTTRKELAEKNQVLTDSINYAQRIQHSMLPTTEDLEKLLGKYLLLYLPKDIVSGDFLWIKNLGGKKILAVADGTGHGVPGAFMSMLGITLLNETVKNNNLDKPGEILDQMREGVKSALQQTGKSGEAKDGMDMALCIIDQDTLELKFSGSYNSVVIVRKSELIEIKGDRQPIAIHHFEKEFTTHDFQLVQGDIIFLFSDGFADQIGENTNKKFLTKNFKKLLQDSALHPMEEQQQILGNVFAEWKGESNQLDDVLVLGFKIFPRVPHQPN